MIIGVIGCGYVGLANAVLLSHAEKILIWDNNPHKLEMINEGKLPLNDYEMKQAFEITKKNVHIASDFQELANSSRLIIISLPTNYNQEYEELDTSCIVSTVKAIDDYSVDREIIVVIRSTVPIGFTDKLQNELKNIQLCFMPEFLREGSAFEDEINPQRVVIGGNEELASGIETLYLKAITIAGGIVDDFQRVTTKEAEAIKLFSNAYLSMRLAFFNELDMYAEENNMSTKKIISGVCSDERIGKKYNRPSFGYGGYCLPKDTKQLSKQMKSPLVGAIDYSNLERKKRVVKKVLEYDGDVGIYRILSKQGADNIRNSVMIDIINEIVAMGKKIYLYEPLLCKEYEMKQVIVVDDLEELNEKTSIIIANWMTEELVPYLDKIYTRDVYWGNEIK